MRIEVIRHKSSYDFKADPNAESSFANNWKHNSEDEFQLISETGYILFKCKVQSVANYCFGDYATGDSVEYGDTIAPGQFKIKCFVEPRNFHGEIHGIVETKDIDGQWINHDSMQTTANGFQNGRFLIHSRWSDKVQGDTNSAWSAGCFIMSTKDLETLAEVLHEKNVQPGDIIEGVLTEI